MTTTTGLKQEATATMASGFAAAGRTTDVRAAQARWLLLQNGPKPATETIVQASNGAAEFGRGNLEAMARSTHACMTGLQDLGRQYVAAMMGLTQHALDDAKAFAGARNPQDAVALQASLARASVERALGEGAKLQRAAWALAGQVYAPLARRATAALERTTPSRAA